MADRSLRLWEPKQLSWWVAVLFMIGAALFALGCALYLAGVQHERVLESLFFTGSIFFTSAACCQLHQAIKESKSARWSALSQLIGTFMFNMNTFDSFFNLDWIEQDFLVWTPNILGSILFQISGSLAMRDICKRWWCWDIQSIDWRIGVINFGGCLAFLISAAFAFVTPSTASTVLAVWATIFTLIGACCFFAAALCTLRLATN